MTLAAAETLTLVTTVLTSVSTGDAPPLPLALSASRAALADGGAAVLAQASVFWSGFWAKSSVSLPSQPTVERFWFAAQYLVGMASRGGRVAPGLWGPWVSTDSPAWDGGYTCVHVRVECDRLT